jgi:hypothetical protein
LRGKLKEKGLRDFTVSNRGYDVTITSKQPLKKDWLMVTIFQSIQSIQIDIFSEYLSDFDMYENMRGETILEFLFYISEEDYEDFAKENIHLINRFCRIKNNYYICNMKRNKLPVSQDDFKDTF